MAFRARLASLAAGTVLLWTCAVRAQPPSAGSPAERELDLARLVEAIADLVSAAVERTQDGVFKFLETVELFNAEAEIDRLVGSPWDLNDSTTYKLGLLPFHIRYPIYKQLVRQMTRQDDLRSRRIHSVTPDAVNVIALRLDLLRDDNVRDEVRRSLLTHFNVREMVDLGFFVLAQQPFFPDTDEGWSQLKRGMADRGAAIAAAALVTGAALEVGALQQSGTIARLRGGDLRLGWYGGFRRLGLGLRPHLRGGLTAAVPGVEVAAGLAERIRPRDGEQSRALELAAREGWLNRLTRPQGWDAFFEGALRRVLASGPAYEGERTTGRAGLFARRDTLPGFRNLALRSSAEVESDFLQEIRYAVGLGFEHAPTGLATVLQASRTRLVGQPFHTADTRGGIFLAGTMEPLTQTFVEAMRARARLVLDEWEALGAAERRREAAEERLRLLGTARLTPPEARAALDAVEQAMIARERHLARLAPLLADYLESRRVAYAVCRWTRRDDGLHGPLDPDILGQVHAQVLSRVAALSGELERAPEGIERIARRHARVRAAIAELETDRAVGAALEGYRRELAALEESWRQASARAWASLDAYYHYRDSARRMLSASGRPGTAEPAAVRPDVIRRLLVLRTFSLR